jgi:L-alanine-DL-glutamate epimerase-like enolase superfamily enzyme
VLADQSLRGPASALDLAANHRAHGLSIKLAACGGLSCARQIESIARAAGLVVMISCVVEPALLAAAGLALALSSPGVHYGDLDGFLHLASDPSLPGFRLDNGWLVALDVPGIGGTVELD